MDGVCGNVLFARNGGVRQYGFEAYPDGHRYPNLGKKERTMQTYLISYDLRKPGRNYDGLYKAIKSFSIWARPLESFWVVVSTQSSATIRDQLEHRA